MNAYLKRQREDRERCMIVARRVAEQFDCDTLAIALNYCELTQFGYDRIMKILDFWEKIKNDYNGALQPTDEQVYYQTKIDQELQRIARSSKKGFIPFKERYPELKDPK